jgi:hypothetical protein
MLHGAEVFKKEEGELYTLEGNKSRNIHLEVSPDLT